MEKIKYDEYMVVYDDELGVVYAPRRGLLKTTTPDHAQAIEDCLKQYFDNTMSVQEKQDLENYMERSFGNSANLPISSCPNLLERDTLRRLEILVANDCNLRCRYCYAHGGNYGKKAERMSPETVCTYLQALLIGKYKSVSVVMFFGGEPTLCPDTIQAACEFFERNVGKGTLEKMPQFVMVSNGTLIDEKMARLIHKYDINVTISIDGPQDINDLNRVDAAGNGAFERAVRGIELLRAVGKPPGLIEATYTAAHAEMGYTKEDIYDYLKEKFDTDIMVGDCESGGDERLVYSDQDMHIRDGEMPLSNIAAMGRRLSAETLDGIGCDVALASVSLLPNGELYPCHYFVGHPEYRLASFRDGAFDFSLYENILPRFTKLNKLSNPLCEDCWAKAVCKPCPAFALLHEETEIAANCHYRKNLAKYEILQCARECNKL